MAVWGTWDLIPASELSDVWTVHSQSIRFAKTFFLQEIAQPAVRNERFPFNALDFGVRENLLGTKDLTIESDVAQ